ncbi:MULTISPECIES: polysaccharide lyase [Thiomicrorhabdus]|uniref:Polysaccharide lyase 14 domain-containing protein n=1 Tax=Thiomicrorhabdus heinhorstiae TaxID=2748010 RepID=A0ABS0BWI1_9GAMM|nr:MULTISPECIES: hypothetical protein [Thiomicrorhabdus]MBF6058144.1 hypothetical protein [Thiomicrorhabdus heinhorstiae]
MLLQENFDKVDEKGFAAKALLHPKIELVKGVGPDGSNAIRVAYVGYERGSERVVLRYPLSSAVNEATLSFDVKFAKDFQWVLGGKLHGLGPKHPVTGGKARRPDGWSARIMFMPEGRCRTYLYDQDKMKKWGVGEATAQPVFTAGQWHHVVLQVSLNSPGELNGFARIFVDGKVVMVTENVVFRGVGGSDTKIQQFLFSTFHGGSSPKWAPRDRQGDPMTVYAYFDNFLVIKGIHENNIGQSNPRFKP